MVLSDHPYGVTQNDWDKKIDLERLWPLYKKIAKTNAAMVFTATEPYASELITSNSKMFRYDLIWAKNKPRGFLNANRMPLRQHESILVFYQKLPTYNPQKTTGHKPTNAYTKHTSDGSNYGKTKQGISGGGQTDRFPISILYFPVVNNDDPDRINATQKPVDLFEYLIKTYTEPGEVVLDNCLGGGTSAIAAAKCGRAFMGIEKCPEMCDKAIERIDRYLDKKDKENNGNWNIL